jgi:hypothetical protein
VCPKLTTDVSSRTFESSSIVTFDCCALNLFLKKFTGTVNIEAI